MFETFESYIQDYHAPIKSKNNYYGFITPTITYFSYFIKETDNSIYFKLTQFYFDNDAQLEALKRFSESADLCRNKDFVILDVRGNPGGDNSYEQKFMADLYKKDSKLDDYLPISTTSIYSPASTKALTAMIKMALDTDNPSIKKWLKKIAKMEKIAERESVKILLTSNNKKYSQGIFRTFAPR